MDYLVVALIILGVLVLAGLIYVGSLSVAILAALGLIVQDAPYRPTRSDNPGRPRAIDASGRSTVPSARIILRAADRTPPGHTGPVLIVGHTTYESYQLTLYLNALRRQSGTVAPLLYDHGLPQAQSPEEFAPVLRRVPGAIVVVFTTNPDAVAFVERVRQAAPDAQLVVIDLE